MVYMYILRYPVLVACRCLDRIIMEFTTGTIDSAGGGPHSVEITVAGETRVAENILRSFFLGQTSLVSINLSDLGFSTSCIDQKRIDSIVFIENSNDGLYVTHVEFFASFFERDLANWIDGDEDPSHLRVPVYPMTA